VHHGAFVNFDGSKTNAIGEQVNNEHLQSVTTYSGPKRQGVKHNATSLTLTRAHQKMR